MRLDAAFLNYMGWTEQPLARCRQTMPRAGDFFAALPMTAYNAVTPVEAQASRRLVGAAAEHGPAASGSQQVMWAASGSEAIQKALWAGSGPRSQRAT